MAFAISFMVTKTKTKTKNNNNNNTGPYVPLDPEIAHADRLITQYMLQCFPNYLSLKKTENRSNTHITNYV
jgi:hypothetical protein